MREGGKAIGGRRNVLNKEIKKNKERKRKNVV